MSEHMPEPVNASLIGLRAELRLRVLEYALVNVLGDPIYLSSKVPEPPISRVCRSLRTESLPIFYKVLVLDIAIWVKCDSNSSVRLSPNHWYHHLSDTQIGYVRKIQFRFRFAERFFGELLTMIFTIALSPAADNFSISAHFSRDWLRSVHRTGDPEDCKEVQQALEQHLSISLSHLLDEKSGRGLRKTGIDRLLDVDPNSLPR